MHRRYFITVENKHLAYGIMTVPLTGVCQYTLSLYTGKKNESFIVPGEFVRGTI